jgi:hypothetical protein
MNILKDSDKSEIILDKIESKDIKKEIDAPYYIAPKLKNRLDKKIIAELEKTNHDYVMVIDGREGSGKSTLAFQIGKYVDPSLDLSRIAFNPEQFRETIFKAKKNQCVIYDEAITGFSSRASLSGVNRVLISLMMQMRQKNLFVIIVLPTYFLLDKYVALFRARVLIHVYESYGKRGYFKVYNYKQKKDLYLLGKITYSYVPKKVKTRFRGRFYGVFALGDSKVEDKYNKLKEKALIESEKNPMSAGQVKYREQRDICIYVLRKTGRLTYRQISNFMNDYDFDISYAQVRNICAKFGDKEAEDELNKEKEIKKDSINELTEKEEEIEELEYKTEKFNEFGELMN